MSHLSYPFCDHGLLGPCRDCYEGAINTLEKALENEREWTRALTADVTTLQDNQDQACIRCQQEVARLRASQDRLNARAQEAEATVRLFGGIHAKHVIENLGKRLQAQFDESERYRVAMNRAIMSIMSALQVREDCEARAALDELEQALINQ